MTEALGRWALILNGEDIPDREAIGGKAHSVAKMQSLGLNGPPAFVVTTAACSHYLEHKTVPDDLADELWRGIAYLEEALGRSFGGERAPLLVSVRSGAAVSMPGMMDTVLNLGINAEAERALAEESGDAAFAHEVHRRFYQMYAKIVLKTPADDLAPDADAADWRAAIADAGGGEVPQDPREQLLAAVGAVFGSWNARRAKRYRKHHGIADDLGTAALVQAMVFGNLDDRSGTGVLFSRNPLDGAPEPYGEYLHRAQGEDVVSGERTPVPIETMKESLPDAHAELMKAAALLERAHGDVQDIEFTVQQSELFFLQSRAAKRGPQAAVRFAVDLAEEGIVDKATALKRLNAEQVRILLRPRLADEAAAEDAEVLARGEPACQGIGVGTVVADPDEAFDRAEAGEAVVLARRTTSPDDVHGMTHARAVITELGGATSHAAVVSRALGVPCVVGCGEGALTALAGKTVTVDGDKGRIVAGSLPVKSPTEHDDPYLAELVAWARERAPLRVVRPEEVGDTDIFDLDRAEGADEVERYADLLKGRRAAKGGLIATDEGVAAAIDAGVETIVCDHVLPPLIAAIHHAEGGQGRD